MSLTEVEHFRRLVDFVQEVEDYARVICDPDLAEMVAQLREELGRL